MKIIFLGTNGWYDTKETGSTVSTLLDTKDHYIILDAGFGLAKAAKYITQDKPVLMFISHLHLDHICGLHVLPKFNFKHGLKIFIAKQSVDGLKTFLAHPYTINYADLRYPVEFYGLEEGQHDAPIKFECRKLKHIDNTFGYRFQLEDKIIAYCSDTAVCKNDKLLAQNSDILIHECSYLPGKGDPDWGHSSPEEAGKMAKEVNVKKLLLTHFSPNSYKTIASRKIALKASKAFFPKTITAKDDMIINV